MLNHTDSSLSTFAAELDTAIDSASEETKEEIRQLLQQGFDLFKASFK